MDRYTDGKVTTPINVADLSQLLNRSQEDINKVEYSNLLTSVGGLCTHPNINKWAKYKPIKHHVIGNITEEQRTDRKGNGELYGVIVTGGIVLANLHDVAFTYVRPEGGEKSPYRLGDFLGYDHKAKPSVSGEMQWGGKGIGYISIDSGYSISVHIDVNKVSDGSIRLEDFLPSGITENNIAEFYPVAVIGNWAIVMRHKDGFSNYNIRKLTDNGITYTDFVADMGSFLPDSSEGFPSQSGTKLLLSIGLIKEYKQEGKEGIFDLTEWKNIKDGYITTLPALGIPALDDSGLCGMQVTLYSEYDKYKVSIGFLVAKNGFTVSLSPEIADEFIGITGATLNVRFTQGNASFPVLRTISVPKPSDNLTEITRETFSWIDFGLVSAPTGEYELYAQVVYQGHVIGSETYSNT